jgi:predicted ester cyclase
VAIPIARARSDVSAGRRTDNRALVGRKDEMAIVSTDTNKRVIADAFRAINDGRLEELAGHPGFWETRQVIPAARQVFADWHTSFMQQIAEGDKVFSYFAVHFTHTAPFAGVPTTGRRVTIEGFSFDQVVDGVVVEHNSTTSWADVLRQLGAPGFAAWPARDPRPLADGVCTRPDTPENTTAHRAAVAWLMRALSRGDQAVLAKHPGAAALREEFVAIRAAFPDLEYAPVCQLAEGDRVGMRATLHGTHTGALFGLAPTGKAIVWDVFCLARVVGGVVVDARGSGDWNAILGQLGLFPAW